jgi:hypothetical protein
MRTRSSSMSLLVIAALAATACTASPAPSTGAAVEVTPVPASPGITATPRDDGAAFAAIRGWLDASNAGDLEKAATFFAPGARVGTSPELLVETHSTSEVVAQLHEAARCLTQIGSMRADSGTIWVDATISGPDCPFLQAGETTHGILIPVQVVDGLITCTCPAESGRGPSRGGARAVDA